MSKPVKPIPDGFSGATPYLTCKGADEAIKFYKKAFGAEELSRVDAGGMIGHAEVKIGEAIIMLSEESEEWGFVGPKTLGGSPVAMMLYVDDVDSFTEAAVEAGLKVIRPVEDQFYGDRGGQFEDPFGHKWWIATHIEDVPEEEMNRRAKALFGG